MQDLIVEWLPIILKIQDNWKIEEIKVEWLPIMDLYL